MALSWTLDKLGPFGRSAEDCGLILQVIAGKDGKDPGSAGKSFYYTPQYARPMKDLKIGFAPVDFNERADPAARSAFAAALAVLKDLGVQMVETKLPRIPVRPDAFHHSERRRWVRSSSPSSPAARWMNWPTSRRSPG